MKLGWVQIQCSEISLWCIWNSWVQPIISCDLLNLRIHISNPQQSLGSYKSLDSNWRNLALESIYLKCSQWSTTGPQKDHKTHHHSLGKFWKHPTQGASESTSHGTALIRRFHTIPAKQVITVSAESDFHRKNCTQRSVKYQWHHQVTLNGPTLVLEIEVTF